MEFSSTKDVSRQGLFILIHGRSGAGKTSLIKTIPNAEKDVLVISAESGLLPLRKMDVDVFEVTKFSDMEQILEYLAKTTEYKWVVVDSLTEIGDLCLDVEARRSGQVVKPGWDEYYWYNDKLTRVVRQLRGLRGLHVILTCLSALDVDDSRGKMMPIIPGKALRMKLSQYFDLVLYLTVDEDGKRQLITDLNNHVDAKGEAWTLDNPEEADLGVIVEKIYGDRQPEREVTPDPEREAQIAKLQKSIDKGEKMISKKTGEEVEAIRKTLWTASEYDEEDLGILNAYYLILRDKHKELTNGNKNEDA